MLAWDTEQSSHLYSQEQNDRLTEMQTGCLSTLQSHNLLRLDLPTCYSHSEILLVYRSSVHGHFKSNGRGTLDIVCCKPISKRFFQSTKLFFSPARVKLWLTRGAVCMHTYLCEHATGRDCVCMCATDLCAVSRTAGLFLHLCLHAYRRADNIQIRSKE